MAKKEKKENKKKKKINTISKIFAVVLLICVIVTLGMILFLNVLPMKKLLLVITISLLITYILCLFLFKKNIKIGIKIPSIVISGILSIFCIIICYYIGVTFNFMGKVNSFNKTYAEYYVVVKNDSAYAKIEDLKDKSIGVYNEETKTYNDALDKLNSAVQIKTSNKISIDDLKSNLLNDGVDAILLSNTAKDQIEADDDKFESEIKIVYTIKVEVESIAVEANKVDVTKDVFTVYISGIDTYGEIALTSRSDVNMLVTVNPNTNQVLLTSIPRDYYVQLHGTTGYKDKLTHAGIYGVNMSIETIKDFMGIDINYYIKVNFDSLIKVVDEIGGIDVYSDTTFVPWTNQSITIHKGMVHMNGAMALAFARERHAYEEGDRHRVQNQQDVLTAIINKITSTPSLMTKYSSLLNSISSSIDTNIDMNSITDLIRVQLDKNPSWTIKKYSLNGSDSSGYTYSMGAQLLYVMQPDQSTVTTGASYINGMVAGKTFDELGLK